MKRFFFPILSAVLFSGFLAVAQTPPPSAQELQEKVERLSGDVERLTQDNQSLKNKISALSDEIGKMREDVAKANANANSGVQEDIKRLADKLKEVDEKRVEDNKRIADQVKGIGQSLKDAAKAEARTARTHVPESKEKDTARSQEGGEQTGSGVLLAHTIESGETLSAVLLAYNKEFKSKGLKAVTMQQVMDANPGVNWNRLTVGQKIAIPKPSK